MGDIVVDIFLENLKQSITNFQLFLNQLQSLEMEIKYLREYLKVTEKKRNEHIEVMNLVRQIRDVVFVSQAYKQDDRFLNFESVKKKIKTLTAKVKQMYDENMYDINGTTVKNLKHSYTGSSGSGGRNTFKVVEEKTLVGFKDEIETLMGELHDSGEGGRLEIISITGAGGGGKTMLAKEVYDHPLTSQKFEIRAWANVSQDYNKTMKKDLLIHIMKSASPEKHEDYGENGVEKLGEMVYKFFQGRKYLIVMDDIWDIEAWNDIQRSFPRECKGSKVLLTSRLPVQPTSVPCVSHCLKPLPHSCSWELLQKKVFGKEQCPPKLVDIGNQIAEKCQGLPLAVVTIAGILAMEDKTLDMWEKVAKNLCSIIAKNQEGCMEILELSYNHLPLHLKACFLYIGGHPEDSEIPVRELIWLWIALGFIQQSDEGKSLEAIAQDYLINLIDRSLVMVARKSKSHGEIKACRIDDLLRELCLKKAKEDNFLVQNYWYGSFSPLDAKKDRCFSVGRYFCHEVPRSPRELPPRLPRELPPSPCELPPRLLPRSPRAQIFRSQLFQSKDPVFSLTHSLRHSWFVQDLPFIVENFDILRVLHLISPTSIEKERRGVEDPVHLRYFALSLPEGKSHVAHDSFPYLPNLETLNLEASKYREKISLPCDIVKMVKLRHLYTKEGRFEYHHFSNYDEDDKQGIFEFHDFSNSDEDDEDERFEYHHFSNYDEDDKGNMMDSLQTLHRICACEHCLRLLKRTPNLRKLGLFGSYILADLEFLKCLEILCVEDARIGLLKLPSTLTRLTLHHTRLKWEELSIILQTLPSLEVLKLLTFACVGPVWNTSELEEGFSQLKYLKLEFLDIVEWSASEDQFPGLEVLVIDYCRKLEQIPIDFANLNELREITIRGSRVSAEESAREIQEKQRNRRGDDDCLNITFWNNSNERS